MDVDVRGTRPGRGRKSLEVPIAGAVRQSTAHDRYRQRPKGTEPVLDGEPGRRPAHSCGRNLDDTEGY